MKRVYPFLPYLLLAAAMQVAIALWVPVNRTLVVPYYFKHDLFRNFEPRALIGTVSTYLDLDETQFLILTQAALFTWILGLSLLIATPRQKRMPDPLNGNKAGLIFLFTFSTLPFITNAISGFVDIFAAVALVLAVGLLFRRDRSSASALCGVVALMGAATLIHEKSLFECLILLLWIAFTRERKRAAGTIAAYGVFLFGYFFLTAGKEAAGAHMTSTDYLGILAQVHRFLFYKSANVFGIVFGGGLLWVLYGWLARTFLRRRKGQDNAFPPPVLVIGMLGLCFAPLLVGWDTNRLVAVIWLPTLLLLKELDFPTRSERSPSKHRRLAAACLVQALIPPVFVWSHNAIALNCYGSFFVRHLEEAQAPHLALWPVPVTLRLTRPDISALYSCAPIHFTRPGKRKS